MAAHRQSTIDRAAGRLVSARDGRRIAGILAVLVLVLAAISGAVLYQLTQSVGSNIPRVSNVFSQVPATTRPADQAATTFLIVGTDSRSPDPTTGSDAPAGVNPGSTRSDVIMLASLAADDQSAAVVSIPRDSWVDIPGRGMNKINAAYAFGGPSLLTHTVEDLTRVRVNHFAVIDFAGFQGLVDSVGGIDIQVAHTTSDRGVTFRKGPNHLDGAAALIYVRQRYGLPNGDMDRAHREQNALRAWLTKVMANGAFSNPIETYRILVAMSQSISVDDSLTNDRLASLALSSRDLQSSSIRYLTAPISGFGREDARAVVYLDSNRANDLWKAMRGGTINTYLETYPSDQLAEIPA